MYDYFIIGQGIAGSILAYLLHTAGRKTLILDPGKKNASLVAGALINPITGKRLNKTWMADTLIPYSFSFYRSLEKTFNLHFFREMNVTRIFGSIHQANDWDEKRLNPLFFDYISKANADDDLSYIDTALGFTKLKRGAHIDTDILLSGFKNFFDQNKMLKSVQFDMENISYNAPFCHDNLQAKNIIFCDGWRISQNPLFKYLPFLPSKGDVFTLEIPGATIDHIISRGIFLLPMKNGKTLTGSTYRWNDLDEGADAVGYAALRKKLERIIKTPFQIIEHKAGIRPTVQDRRPILGRHPKYKNIFLFNGLGTKGFLLAPFFAEQMRHLLLENQPVLDEVSINRFYKSIND